MLWLVLEVRKRCRARARGAASGVGLPARFRLLPTGHDRSLRLRQPTLLRQEVPLNLSHTATAARSLAFLRRSWLLKNAVRRATPCQDAASARQRTAPVVFGRQPRARRWRPRTRFCGPSALADPPLPCVHQRPLSTNFRCPHAHLVRKGKIARAPVKRVSSRRGSRRADWLQPAPTSLQA